MFKHTTSSLRSLIKPQTIYREKKEKLKDNFKIINLYELIHNLNSGKTSLMNKLEGTNRALLPPPPPLKELGISYLIKIKEVWLKCDRGLVVTKSYS